MRCFRSADHFSNTTAACSTRARWWSGGRRSASKKRLATGRNFSVARCARIIKSRKKKSSISACTRRRILGDFANSQILDASIEYDFFTLIHKGFQSADEIARAAGTDPRATRIVLDSLPALGLIEKRDGKYYLTPTAEVFLVQGKPSYVGDFRHVALALWDGMAHLKESLKTGKPLSRMDTGAELQVWEKLVLGIIVIAEPAAKALCDILKIGTERKAIKAL